MATTIDVKTDVREFYDMDTDTDDYTLENVNTLQNQSNFRLSIVENDTRRWFVEVGGSILFSDETKVSFARTSIPTVVGAS